MKQYDMSIPILLGMVGSDLKCPAIYRRRAAGEDIFHIMFIPANVVA